LRVFPLPHGAHESGGFEEPPLSFLYYSFQLLSGSPLTPCEAESREAEAEDGEDSGFRNRD